MFLEYGKLMDRLKAVMIDGIIIIGLGFLATKVTSSFEMVPDTVRIILFVSIFILYDPLFTSIAGGTLGHLIIGLRVRMEKNEKRKISFPKALIRFILKVALGWVSLLTVTGNAKKQAIHDSAAGSVIVKI